MTSPSIDLDRLMKLRLVVARFGEMDLARWWNTKGQLGKYGSAALRRGFPRTHRFAQARAVFAVAAHRCSEVFEPPGSVTLWQLPEATEEEIDARWERWLDNASEWEPFFEKLEKIAGTDLASILRDLDLVTATDVEAAGKLRRPADGRAVLPPGRLLRNRRRRRSPGARLRARRAGAPRRPVHEEGGRMKPRKAPRERPRTAAASSGKGSRANVASSFTVVKGAMIEETHAVFAAWDFARSKRENLDRLREENFIGATSDRWLVDVAKVLNRRFDPGGRDRALVLLAKSGCDLEEWKPLLLWHMTRDEFLVRDFLQNWLFPAYVAGAYRVRPEEVQAYLLDIGKRGAETEHAWTAHTSRRVAAGLLKIAADFGLLRGKKVRELASFHLPERSFLYLLHAIQEERGGPAKVVGAPDWRLFLMHPADVEQELLRLHQFRKLEYQVAGSLVQLSLPCATSIEYAEKMAA